ncbi:3-deoxy-7-phosphoheptulonate synthase [Candidatus Contubernalis alkaliaceticus]|uniref:3-deoxy-7-phosphoheptulonate synthase n=1 Tax=Candidatus Contubernalis alkaliaceticus TaxID=338645 RepID=UPI001F4C3605|nr:3-deoxy-7-phosphoheptulonate synthase [Candidatus Contubernalis alkalaceticus]UNC92603.1 3-deoxy-7-phosphoheptulonate synthase [Candidatus Contubernalis alkalaceticus]
MEAICLKSLGIKNDLRLAARNFNPGGTIIPLGGVEIGGKEKVIIAGPCAVESREQLLETAGEVKKAGAKILRGGAFKPRSSPYSFQGLGIDGLKILQETGSETGLLTVTEVIDTRDVELVSRYVDILQLGSRSMQNFQLLLEVGKLDKPVLLKRGISSTIEEWLLAAEYIMSAGNHKVILCERGIRTFEPLTRNTLDLNAIPLIKKLSHLPVFVDPSHGTGIRDLVPSMGKAALVAGADGLMVEVHGEPSCALSDGHQSLLPEEFAEFMEQLERFQDIFMM